ncbi:UDP-2,3-diacylglucosamine pyrophosphatase LpxH [Salipiger aestuarii]|uniref:UDP-2,3-diacylglucosamine pyrophosphatase LpxH n=1 Tax=Salipiger aestuarii TaxID=568098 RepID=A0A327Y5U2_9RHOB|nr:UDP-2,3-diacylglucosamine diphosphatase [Salipiger aestuarii]RAK13829.1 UDP-2,3-diacylglucosamine pyrophosphatase LpxH [Salipiger aestuarii]
MAPIASRSSGHAGHVGHATRTNGLRSLFLSDLHLGARASRPAQVLDFLKGVEADTIYLVGDIFDLWHGGRVHWNDAHEAVMTDLAVRAGNGARIVYLPGNHDAAMRVPDARVAGWELREAVVHRAADGRRYLVLHGDQCDPRFLRWHFMTRLGSRLDAMLRQTDLWHRRHFALAHDAPSPAQRIIERANTLLAMGDRFEKRLVKLARASGTTGVICGHSHKPVLRHHDDVIYANCGDWIDSLTALAEDQSGALRMMQHVAPPAAAPSGPRPATGKGGALAEGMA